jgi:hypothetical protein
MTQVALPLAPANGSQPHLSCHNNPNPPKIVSMFVLKAVPGS